MNKNTRNYYNICRKAAKKGDKTQSVAVPKIISGVGESSVFGSYIKTFNFKYQPKHNRHAKVAFSGTKKEFARPE